MTFLKVLFVLGFPNPFPGAAWTRIHFFGEKLCKEGYGVEVLGAFTPSTFKHRGAVRLHSMNVFNFIPSTDLRSHLAFTINFIISFLVSTLFIMARIPNLAIISVPKGDVGLGAMMACQLLHVKYVVDYRDQWEDYALSSSNRKGKIVFYANVKKFSTSFYEKSQKVITVTPNFVDSLMRRRLVDVKLVPNGADVKTFKPLALKKDAKTFKIFYSGGIGRYYRLDITVKSIKNLVDNGLQNIKLVIAGSGEIQKILNLAKMLDISTHLDYRGVVNNKTQLAELIAEADVGLIPYDDNPLWKNSLPAKFFEYCACGLPVIATTYEDSLLAGLITNYKIGKISQPLNEEKLAETIRQLYKNEKFRKTAGKMARLLVEEEFDRNKIVTEFFSLITTLA